MTVSPADEQVGADIARENLLKEINFLANSPGVNAFIRGRLQALHRTVRKLEAALTAALARPAEGDEYDTADPRCLAAHNAGEATAVKLLKSDHDYSPKYVAMAVVQDALVAYLALSTSRPAQAEGGWKPIDLFNALRRLTDAEMKYRHAHDLHGDGSLDSGRAWDKMRQAGDHARDLLRVVEPKLVDIKQPEG